MSNGAPGKPMQNGFVESFNGRLIAVLQQTVGLACPPDRHSEGVDDKLGCHLGLHRPAGDTSEQAQLRFCG